MKTFNEWLQVRDPELYEGWMGNVARAGVLGASMMLPQMMPQQANAEPPAGAVSKQYYDKAEITSATDNQDGTYTVVVTMPFSKTFEATKVGFHVGIAKQKAIDEAKAAFGKNLTPAGAEKDINGKVITFKFTMK